MGMDQLVNVDDMVDRMMVQQRTTQRELHELQIRENSRLALMTRLPKFNGRGDPDSFFLILEKQLHDNGVPAVRWLDTLEALLEDKARHALNYCHGLTEGEKVDYNSTKIALKKYLGFSVQTRIDQAATVRWMQGESIQEMVQESVRHVTAFKRLGDSAEEVQFKWIMVRTLAKCTQECAEKVWARQPRTPAELVDEISIWEARHGSCRKLEKTI